MRVILEVIKSDQEDQLGKRFALRAAKHKAASDGDA